MTIRVRLLAYFGLIAALGAITLVVLWLVGVPLLGIEGMRDVEYRRATDMVSALADKERDSFERWFADRRRELQLLSRNELFAAAISDSRRTRGRKAAVLRESLERQLAQIKESNLGAYNYLYVVDPLTGKIVAGSEPDWGLPPPEHVTVLAEATQPGLNEFVYLLDEAYGPAVVVTDQIGVMDETGALTGELAGVLVASVGLRGPLESDADGMRQYLGSDGAVMVLDRRARMLATTAVAGENFGNIGDAVAHGSEGVKMLGADTSHETVLAFRHLHLGASDGLTLVAVRSTAEALAAIRNTFVRLGVVGLFVFLLAMALVLFAARRITTAEAEIRQLNASLEARVEERTHELEQSNTSLIDTLGNLERTRDDLVQSEKLASLGALVAGVAHEMNTPIGNALLVATTLNAEIDTFAKSAAEKLTRSALEQHIASTITGSGMLVSNLERAAELVAGFKQLAVDQTSEQRRVYALHTMVDEVMVAMRPALKRAPYQMEIDVPADITLDGYPGPLSRVLVNFINNALLHAFEGRAEGHMSLRAKFLDADRIELVFADDGAGMPADVLRRIFDPFYTTKLGRGGSGLGMHIAYSIITVMHGGHLEVTSTPGQGAQFRCVLPAIAPMGVDRHPAPAIVGADGTESA